MNLFKVLVISWLAGISLSFFKDANVDYQVKCLLMSVVYFLLSAFCYRYIKKETKSNKRVEVYLIASLCICMIISSWFNYLFIDKRVYYALIGIRADNFISWKNVYMSVELLALLMVGRNGIICFSNWVICRCRWFNVIIANNTAYNHGR